jgi:pimeloyl-ACP methyl ester carboxylesterase
LEVLEWSVDADLAALRLLFLHEGLGSAGQWRDLPGAVAAATGCTTFAYSRRGYGRSAPRIAAYSPSYMHDEAALALPELVAALGGSRWALVGHSDGASIALLYAAAHAADGVALLAPHVFVEDVTVASIAQARTRYLTTDLGERLARYHNDPAGAFWGWNDIWLSPAFRDWDITACLPRVRCPVLVIQGRDDEYGTLAQVDAIRAGAGGPVDTVVLDDCGHSPQRDRPAETLSLLTRFVQALQADG